METPSPPWRGWFTPKRAIVGVLALVALVIVVLVWFEPQKLFIDEKVDEAAPDAVETQAESGGNDRVRHGKDQPPVTLGGDFRGLDHETSGRATLSKASDDRYYVRLEDFRTENGPDLVVYLSAAPASAEGREFADDFVDLGELKGNIGNQNYVVPEGTDLEQYRSVVIWCRRFTVPFGAAPLEMQ